MEGKMKVKIYTTTTCSWCARVKEFFKEHKIEYEEVNVGEDREAAEEMVKKSGQMGVPVTEIDGEMIIGFNEEKLKKALKLK